MTKKGHLDNLTEYVFWLTTDASAKIHNFAKLTHSRFLYTNANYVVHSDWQTRSENLCLSVLEFRQKTVRRVKRRAVSLVTVPLQLIVIISSSDTIMISTHHDESSHEIQSIISKLRSLKKGTFSSFSLRASSIRTLIGSEEKRFVGLCDVLFINLS